MRSHEKRVMFVCLDGTILSFNQSRRGGQSVPQR
jgi:hypothetical protein